MKYMVEIHVALQPQNWFYIFAKGCHIDRLHFFSFVLCVHRMVIPSFIGSSCALYERGTNAFFLERASMSSLPFGIDDPPKGSKGNDISDLIVDLYQGGKTANLRKGALSPKSLPLVASNFSIRAEARYASYTLHSFCMCGTVSINRYLEL